LREHVTKAKLATKFFGEGGFFPFIYTADIFADIIYGITSTDNVYKILHATSTVQLDAS
jgi:hypothetical protein